VVDGQRQIRPDSRIERRGTPMRSKDEVVVYNMVATPFQDDGTLDLEAYRALLELMCEANVGVYLGSGGAGEGHALTVGELGQLYDVGVATCKGRVPVAANPREARSAGAMLEVAREAVRAGVDLVQLYPLDAGHGMIPTLVEQDRYYRYLLEQLDHPISISVHVSVGYVTPIALLERLTKEFPSIEAINVMGPPLTYFVELGDALAGTGRTVQLYAPMGSLVPSLYAGAFGCMAAEPNLIPHSSRALADAVLAGQSEEIADRLLFMTRFAHLVNRWAPSTARWVKMGLKVLDLPGGNGVMREPHVLPDASQVAEMDAEFKRLGVVERERQLRDE
jgi:4-hydroxy-tetrahydrodipicolinate synthase